MNTENENELKAAKLTYAKARLPNVKAELKKISRKLDAVADLKDALDAGYEVGLLVEYLNEGQKLLKEKERALRDARAVLVEEWDALEREIRDAR